MNLIRLRFVIVKTLLINKLHHLSVAHDIMTVVHNYVVCGGRKSNPATLSVRMQPVKLDQNMGMAVTSIGHGEIFNINSTNQRFILKVKAEIDEERKKMRAILKLPKGRYNTAEEVLSKICSLIDEYTVRWNISSRCSLVKEEGKLVLTIPSELEFMGLETDSPLVLINAEIKDNIVIARDIEIPDNTLMCFMYVSIIEQSYINGRKSRILSVLPLKSCQGYSFHQNQVPTYVPIEVRQFADISISLRDIRGELIEMNNEQDTIITLHLKSLKM